MQQRITNAAAPMAQVLHLMSCVKSGQSVIKQQDIQSPTQHIEKKYDSKKVAIRFLARVQAIWGVKWTSHLTDKEMYKQTLNEWERILEKLKIEEIKRGLERAKILCEWPPSIAQFTKIALDIPSFDSALCRVRQYFAALVAGNNPLQSENVIVRNCCVRISSHTYRELSEKDFRIKFNGIYDDTLVEYLKERNLMCA